MVILPRSSRAASRLLGECRFPQKGIRCFYLKLQNSADRKYWELLSRSLLIIFHKSMSHGPFGFYSLFKSTDSTYWSISLLIFFFVSKLRPYSVFFLTIQSPSQEIKYYSYENFHINILLISPLYKYLTTKRIDVHCQMRSGNTVKYEEHA